MEIRKKTHELELTPKLLYKSGLNLYLDYLISPVDYFLQIFEIKIIHKLIGFTKTNVKLKQKSDKYKKL